jgi:hypothetical protein
MTKFSHIIRYAALVVVAVFLAGCPSSRRITVDGYDDSMLNNKTIYVLLPDTSTVVIANPAAYAASRGVATDGVREALGAELRTRLIESLDARLDSNTTLSYASQAVGGVIPLTPTMFNSGVPKSWDKLKQAGREGGFDYLLVMHGFKITTQSAATGRGPETVEANFTLLDVMKENVMSSGTVKVETDAPAMPADVYRKLAQELSRKLPFYVGSDS